jgi:excinuclease ABC subunit C
MLTLDHSAHFDVAHADEFLEALPTRAAVVLIEPRNDLPGARPLLLRTADLRRRLRLLLGVPDPTSKRVNLREYASAIRYRITGSAFEQAIAQWQHSRALWPRVYRDRLRLRPPALIKLTLSHAYPRAYVTRRMNASGLYFGPFATRRTAEAFLEPFLDLFRARRCQMKIRRDPSFPGCIYSEMKMCLAPCFGGCTDDEYTAEVARIAEFFRSRGTSSTDDLARERELASSELDFERAAGVHRRIEKTETVRHSLPELARCIDKLSAVVLQRAAEEQTIALFVVRSGRIADPSFLHFGELASQPRSVEQILRTVLEPGALSRTESDGCGTQNTGEVPHHVSANAPAKLDLGSANSDALPGTLMELEDHLSLLTRWFFSKPRTGEIFFEEPEPKGWPYRRILRACSRLLAPAAAVPHDPESHD